jgi:DnaJ-class molecular chaperone
MTNKYYIYVECKRCKGTGRIIDHMMGTVKLKRGFTVNKYSKLPSVIC